MKTDSRKIAEYTSCHKCPVMEDCSEFERRCAEEKNKGCTNIRIYAFQTLRDLGDPIMFLKRKIVDFEVTKKKEGWKEDPKDPNNLKAMKLYTDLAKAVNDLDPTKLAKKQQVDYNDNFTDEVVIIIPENVQAEYDEERKRIAGKKKKKVKDDS